MKLYASQEPKTLKGLLICINSIKRSEFLSKILQNSKFLYALVIL